jgi:transcriptional regulator with GAF, ATPase, and Fis domain
MNSLSPGFLAYCETYLGQYHRAVGTLDCYWHTARQKGNQSMAVNFRATLGVVLLLINRKKEGIYHLNAARKEAEDCKNFLALYIILGGLAYSHYLEGDPRKAFDLLISGATIAADAGIIRQYSSPWVLEMLYDLERNGYILPGSTFQDLFDRLMKEPNVHLRGVGLRLKAKELASRGEHKELIMENLLASQDYLQQSGDPVQLGKTRLDLALLKLSEGKLEESRLLAQKARQGLSGFWEESFPDALRFLLEKEEPVGQRQVSSQEILKRFLEINEELVPKSDLEELMGQLVSAMNRFFMAERGGLFWFSGKNSPPVLKAGRNLTQSDVFSESFRPSLALVIKAYRENRSLLVRPECSRHKPGEKKILASLSIPFEMNGQVRGVLYHDNSYLDNCFDFAKGPLLNMLTRHLSTYTEKIWKYRWMVQEAKNSALGKSAQIEALDKGEILGGSEIMEHILTQADRVAQTGATVLIIGETGSGKELLARRIHQKSHRSQEPFIIVDPTTIPDNLVESDLFGHEKGAFTGADRQKAGRLELAHGGTLFVDEIGEIPKHIQGKFLRVLEDKSFVRVGGTRRIVSDFRLLAATNRDLAKEVAAGRFREDLYYRINIFGLKLPPLRERPEDIALLANHYLAFFARKYNYPHLRLSAAEEEILISYTWPGNVRELKNEMERAVLSSDGERLELNLPKQADLLPAQSFNDGPTLDEVERRYIQSVLEKTGGKISGPMGAAKLLGMKRTTLHSRLKKLGLR